MTPPSRRARPSMISTVGLTGAPSAATPVAGSTNRRQEMPESRPSAERRLSYTLRFEEEESIRIDEFVLELRRHLKRRLDRSDIIRVLLRLAIDDPQVREILRKSL